MIKICVETFWIFGYTVEQLGSVVKNGMFVMAGEEYKSTLDAIWQIRNWLTGVNRFDLLTTIVDGVSVFGIRIEAKSGLNRVPPTPNPKELTDLLSSFGLTNVPDPELFFAIEVT